MPQFGIGIVGTGMIAGVIADALAKSTKARLTAVSSRHIDSAQRFTAKRDRVAAVQGHQALIARADTDAIYVATPTAAKEAITLAAIAAGKHVLVEKPFSDLASVTRMTRAAEAKGVVFLDATHFVHHPRMAAIQAATAEKIGKPRSLHTAFYFPFSDRDNIRLDPKQEPMTALGDMAWYSMRAVVEYLRPRGRITKVLTVAERDKELNAIVRASGVIAFESGEASTFDVGYTAGTILQDWQLLGTTGVFGMDDFVLDWTNSFAFQNPDLKIGYSHRTGMATRGDVTFISTPASIPQQIAMVDALAELATSKDHARQASFVDATLKTQEYLDALWRAANS
jgi:predicted dehydrogenase